MTRTPNKANGPALGTPDRSMPAAQPRGHKERLTDAEQDAPPPPSQTQSPPRLPARPRPAAGSLLESGPGRSVRCCQAGGGGAADAALSAMTADLAAVTDESVRLILAAAGPRVPGHVMTMAVTHRLGDIAVSCSCRDRGDHLVTRPVLPASEAYRAWAEHVRQAVAAGTMVSGAAR